MKKKYEIIDMRAGEGYGQYDADSEEEALEAMARKNGYSSYAAMLEAQPRLLDVELDINEVEPEESVKP